MNVEAASVVRYHAPGGDLYYCRRARIFASKDDLTADFRRAEVLSGDRLARVFKRLCRRIDTCSHCKPNVLEVVPVTAL